jgi:hypothetical protein
MNATLSIPFADLGALAGPGDLPNYVEAVPMLTPQERLAFVRNYASKRAALVARIQAAERAIAGGSKIIDPAAVAAAKADLVAREDAMVAGVQNFLPIIAQTSPAIAASIAAAITARRLLSGQRQTLGIIQVPLIVAIFAILAVAAVVVFVSWHLIDSWAWEADRAAARSFVKAQVDENTRRTDDGLPPRPIVPDPVAPPVQPGTPGSGSGIFSALGNISPLILIGGGLLALLAFARK